MAKQAVVMRRDLRLRRAEVASFVARASSSFLYDSIDAEHKDGILVHLTQEEREWFLGDQKTIVLGVKSEDALRDVMNNAEFRGLTVSTLGHKTEGDVYSVVCVAIGPHDDETIDAVTGKLKLM